MSQQHIAQFVGHIQTGLQESTFVSLSLGNYKGSEDGLKNIYVKKVQIKREDKLSFTYRYKTRDIVKNYDFDESLTILKERLTDGFKFGSLLTTSGDYLLDSNKKGEFFLKQSPPSTSEIPATEHDKAKNRPISSHDKQYLTELNITDKDGKVFKNAQDKYRQINHYIDILSPLVKELPQNITLKVVDMGSGKGYLTFALYDYLINVTNRNAEVTGVEYRDDLVSLCNDIAQKSQFQNLTFVQGSIEDYAVPEMDVLIALHACDTATDDAISKGITANADLIVVAPCCHKQIRREMEKHKAINDVDFLTRHGIFMERQAEMVTDGIRALLLEYFGYKTKVFQFISDAHTPKNVMIAAVKGKTSKAEQEKVL
ncbi:MAG TPA: SAM-dependent methyltransferase, partial [Dyadobacter sp.]|nr:SAM-dependent methyltransferase [Dyadobacter sp.]